MYETLKGNPLGYLVVYIYHTLDSHCTITAGQISNVCTLYLYPET